MAQPSAQTVRPPDPDSDLESVASLPESAESSDIESSIDEEDETDAEREWKESLKQLELILTMVLVPYLGKYFGRKAAYWAFAKVMRWKYPVEVVVTSPTIFKGAGAIGAAASL